jgi:hypothetical protein
VTKADIDAAVALVNRQDSQDIFKTYGPNNDSMLMTLCCKKDDTPTIRAQVQLWLLKRQPVGKLKICTTFIS